MRIVSPLDLIRGDILEDGFTIASGPSEANFKNETRVWGTEADGRKSTRDFNITRKVQVQD